MYLVTACYLPLDDINNNDNYFSTRKKNKTDQPDTWVKAWEGQHSISVMVKFCVIKA